MVLPSKPVDEKARRWHRRVCFIGVLLFGVTIALTSATLSKKARDQVLQYPTIINNKANAAAIAKPSIANKVDASQHLQLMPPNLIHDATQVPLGSYPIPTPVSNGDNKDGTSWRVHFPNADMSLLQPEPFLTANSPQTSIIINQTMISATEQTSRLAILTQKGFKGTVRVNQDRILALEEKNKRILVLLDGHGTLGHTVAHAAAMNLPGLLLANEDAIPKNEKDWISLYDKWQDSLPPSESVMAGSTALIIVQDRHRIAVANVGDSTAIIVNGKNEIVFETKPHKPHLERSRVEKAGGTVVGVEMGGGTSRVMIDAPELGLRLGLAMSRSLGDVAGHRVGVIHEPTIATIEQEDSFVILASDGLWDTLEKAHVAERVGEALKKDSSLLLLQTCEELIAEATAGWKVNSQATYRDDISILVSKL